MISYGHRPTIDERLRDATTRLSRLEQLERDARSVVKRRQNIFRLAKQEGMERGIIEIRKQRLVDAFHRLNAVSAEVLYQKTIVRHLTEGRE